MSWAGALLEHVPQQVEALGPLGPPYFFSVYVFTQCFLVPVLLPTVVGGYLFGVGGGFAITLAAAMTSSTVGFFLARTLLRPQIMKMAEGNETFRKINRAAEREGFKIVLLARLSLVINFSFQNYLFGLTSISFLDFLAATFLGFAPETLAVVYFSSTARGVLAEGAAVPWYVYVLGALALASLVHVMSDIAKRAMDEAVEDDADWAAQPAKAGPA